MCGFSTLSTPSLANPLLLPPLAGTATCARADFLTRERGLHGNTPHMDLLLALAGLGDVVGGLHPHERVHLHSKGFLNAERHIPGKVSLAVLLQL